MGAFLDHRDGKTWRYRKLITLLDGTKKRIKGTPKFANTKNAAEAAERDEIDRWLHPERALARAVVAQEKEAPKTTSKNGPTIGKLIDLMAERRIEGSATSNRSRIGNLNAHARKVFGHMTADEITQAHLNAWRTELRKLPGKREGTKAADQTVKNIMFALTGLISWAVEEERIISKPEHVITVEVLPTKAVRADDDPEVLPVADADVTKLVKASWDPRYTAMILLGADDGLRIGEIIGARWTDIADDTIKIQRSISAYNDIGPPKGKITRRVPLSQRTKAALAKVPRRGFYIFTRNEDDPRSRTNVKRASEPGGHLGYSGLNKAIKSVYRKAGLAFGWSEDGTINVWHSLRHTYGTRLVDAGVHGEQIQRLMGHKDYRTTQRYIRVTQDQLKATIKRVFG